MVWRTRALRIRLGDVHRIQGVTHPHPGPCGKTAVRRPRFGCQPIHFPAAEFHRRRTCHALKAPDRDEQHYPATALDSEAAPVVMAHLQHCPAVHHQHLGLGGEVGIEHCIAAAEAGGGHQVATFQFLGGAAEHGQKVVPRQIQVHVADLVG
jgi:hypothetical protein